jgi:hypothetical protein
MRNDVKQMVVLMIILNVVLILVLAENLIYGIFLVRIYSIQIFSIHYFDHI